MTTADDRLFECAYCGALIHSKIIPPKCEKCGHESFLIHDSTKDKKEENKDVVK